MKLYRWSLLIVFYCSSSHGYSVFSECDPSKISPELGKFLVCTFNAIWPVAILQVNDVSRLYGVVSTILSFCLFITLWNNWSGLLRYISSLVLNRLVALFSWLGIDHFFESFIKGKVKFAGRAAISSVKIKRNIFPWIVPGTINPEFGYVVYGNFSVLVGAPYTVCVSSSDGYVLPFNWP